MLELHLPNRREPFKVVLQEGDLAGLETPQLGAWLLTLHGTRDEIPTQFLFKGGDNKRLLLSCTHAQAVEEIERIIGPGFKLGEPKINSKGPRYYPIVRR